MINKNIFKKAAVIVLTTGLIFQSFFAGSAFASEKDSSPLDSLKINSKYAVLMEADTGNIIYEKNPDHKMYPASTSKIITAVVAMENSKPDDKLVVSQNALKGQLDNGAHIGLKKGEKITVEEALYSLWIESANDSAIAIAENIGGSEKEFAKLLNHKAKELNLKNSHFVTPNGLYDKNHYTTARDLATITSYALKNPEFVKLLKTHKHELIPTNKRKEPVTIYTSHPMAPYKINAYPYILGGKTGYVPESKCNMITVAQKGDIKLICVTGKTNSLYSAAEDAEKLFNKGFKSYKKELMTKDGSGNTISQLIKSGNYVTRHSLAVNNSVSVIIPKEASPSDITFRLNERDLVFPVNKGTGTGTIDAVYKGQVVGSTELQAQKDLSFFLFAVYTGFKIILYAIPVILVILIALIIRKKIKRRKTPKVKGMRTYNTHVHNSADNTVSNTGKNPAKQYNRTTKK